MWILGAENKMINNVRCNIFAHKRNMGGWGQMLPNTFSAKNNFYFGSRVEGGKIEKNGVRLEESGIRILRTASSQSSPLFLT